MLLFHYTTENKTLTQTPNGESPKTTSRAGTESGFCLWQELKNVQQKIARKGEDLDFYSEMVRMKGLEPSRLAALAPKASVSTNSTIRACYRYVYTTLFLSL